MLPPELTAHAARLGEVRLRELMGADPGRAASLLMAHAGIELDFSKQRLDPSSLAALVAHLEGLGFAARRDALLSGGIVNASEGRPALHTAYRHGARVQGSDAEHLVDETQAQTRAFATRVRGGDFRPAGKPVSRVINIGIGGSDLGPRLVADALADHAGAGPELRFVASLDPTDLQHAVAGADPETLLFIIASKSFSTQETLMNGQAARDWLAGHVGAAQAGRHFAAASAARDKAVAFGIASDNVFDFPDWVGGRYSVWSAVGLSLEIGLGPDVFAAFRDGARSMDAHFAIAPLARNLPVVKALVDFWNRNLLGHPSRCVAAYSARLGLLPGYLQQLEMESLGKSVTANGEPAPLPGGALVWGGCGTEVQHSFFQWLHQGGDVTPVDFIGIASHFASDDPRERVLAANMAAQGAALLDGVQLPAGDDPALAAQRSMPGGRISSVLLLDALTPGTLGALLALHEHKVFVESVLYGINPFDQWGVELGKVLTKGILDGELSRYDASTRAMLARTGFVSD
ncbi:glucose-6-phosphate isomerase [Maricaulis sp.]|uniref:glucose-6-phosphate isomerase n=1 Tax=Maricaulis sp. TaxID=1486257 RepID=UPI003A91336B